MVKLQIGLLIAWSGIAALPAQADWRQLTPTSAPPATAFGQLVHDFGRAESVLFGGGSRQAPANNDTWVWDGVIWQLRSPNNRPAARINHAMAYELAFGRVLLFGGGGGGGGHNDTWVWDGTDWTELFPATPPPPRFAASMAYDVQRLRAVLFGGRVLSTNLADTWEWNGSDWVARTQVTQPPAVAWHSMSYDLNRGVTVLFGGYVGGASTGLNETWEWDGTDWQRRLSTNVPPGRYAASLDYDVVRRVHVLFGGWDASVTTRNDLWEWNGVDWTARSPTSPIRARAYHQTAFELSSGRLRLFGGEFDTSSSSQETFEYYTSSLATISAYGAPCNTSLGSLSASSVAGSPWSGDTIQVQLANLPAGCLPFMTFGLQQVQVDLGPFGIPGCWQYVNPLGSVVLPIVGTTATWNWQIPGSTAFVGVGFRLQGGALLAGGNNAFGAATSNGIDAMIGAR